jgi:hypothetical protein
LRTLHLFALLAVLALPAVAERAETRVVLLVLRGTAFESAPASVAGRAAPITPIDGGVTAASMATLFTGASPDRHGLVGNVYREGFAGEERDAFAYRMLAEPLWEAAERQGRRVATLNVRLPGYAHDGVEASWTQRPEAGAGRHDADPPEFGRELDEKVGSPPGPADLAALLGGTLPPDAFADSVERWALHRRSDILHVLRHGAFDLMIVDENVVDAMLHPFTGRDERQVQRALRLADETIAAVMNALPIETVLVVVSPYGMAPVQSAVPLGQILLVAGFAVEGPRAAIRIAAYGPVAHFYLAPGIESASVARALREARGKDGTPLLERVERRGAAPTLPLFHTVRGGDVVALARSGTVLAAASTPVAPRFPGDHGHAADSAGARGFFFAYQRGRALSLPKTVRDIDVAPTVASLLGIVSPAASQGRAHSLTQRTN